MRTRNEIDLSKLIPRYLSFWPYFLTSVILFLIGAFIYLRYATYYYDSNASIEILDKAQDSEMALPTAMTVFNRSMINLDNEIGRLSSYNLNSSVVKELKSNIKFYSVGTIKTTEDHYSEFFPEYSFDLLQDSESISTYSKYDIIIEQGKMNIEHVDLSGEIVDSYSFPSLNTSSIDHNLPFNLHVKSWNGKNKVNKEIIIYPFQNIVQEFIDIISVSQTQKFAGNNYSRGSDQISFSIRHPNKKISVDYLNKLINLFDLDGIEERQLEYKRTIDFVDIRSKLLKKELEVVENNLLNFKKSNGLTDIKTNTSVTIDQQYFYDSDLFKSESQKSLLEFLKNELFIKNYELLPINFGLDDPSINELIGLFNTKAQERYRLLNTGAGKKNPIVLNLQSQLDNYYINISESIENYYQTLELNISKIKSKEDEISDFYADIPKNEKILRSINRELEVKEALYLLLLQKREEASINFAVVKPTIKIIDFARSSFNSVYPSKSFILILAIMTGILMPLIIISLIMFFDNKIHIKEDLKELDIPVIGELPYIKKIDEQNIINIFKSKSRHTLIESIRMVIANLKYSLSTDSNLANVILVSSSIKGEGKTIVSTYLANTLTLSKNKVLLIGADLRNPQIHKFYKFEKSKVKGLSDYLYNVNIDGKSLIKKFGKLDILPSGPIPPNPSELLESPRFPELVEELKNNYDYIIIDSAPCLLVADTLKIPNIYDASIFVVRSNHSTTNILSFISDLKKDKKFRNLNLVLNGIGNSSTYGYKYSYQYGYNYGYGYSYFSDD